jgi:hypothetical protein
VALAVEHAHGVAGRDAQHTDGVRGLVLREREPRARRGTGQMEAVQSHARRGQVIVERAYTQR